MIHTPEELVALVMGDRPDADTASQVPADVWLDAARQFPEARFALAQQKVVPASVLELLAHDPDARIRSMVAMKRKASPALLLGLARDENSGVRLAVASNRSTPREVLEVLVEDAWEEVSARSRQRLAELANQQGPSR